MKGSTNAPANKNAPGSQLVVTMLEVALEKARQGQMRSALLLSFRPNGVDISGEFTHPADLVAATKKLGEAKRTLNEMIGHAPSAKQLSSSR